MSIEEDIAAWLPLQGLKTEFMAYHAFRNAGLVTGICQHFHSAAGVPREIDVVASGASPPTYGFRIRLMCECKYSPEPWVLVFTRSLRSETSIDWKCTPQSPDLLTVASDLDLHAIQTLGTCWHYRRGAPVGQRLLRKAKPGSADVAFEAVQKITHAAWDAVTVPANRIMDTSYEIAMPCVVLDAPLFGALFDSESGEFTVEPLRTARMFWSGCSNGTMLDVVQRDSLDDYANAVAVTFSAVAEVLPTLIVASLAQREFRLNQI